MVDNFESRDNGLWHVEQKEGKPPIETWLCSKLEVLGVTRDSVSSSWGLFLQWKDPDGILHQWAVPKKDLGGRDPSAWLGRLLDEGLKIAPGTRARQLLTLYLNSVEVKERILCAESTGWSGDVFVLSHSTITQKQVGMVGIVGNNKNNNKLPSRNSENQSRKKSEKSEHPERVVLQTQSPNRPYQTGGTLEDWKKTIGSWAVSNTRLAFAICVSLTGPLLKPTGSESGIFHFIGGSSTGKTTGANAAASSWGVGSGPGSFVLSWRSTDNALEAVACLHNDTLLCLDEISQAPGRVVQESAYMLANGRGKGRARQDGSARQAKAWRVMVLSTGETTLAEKIASDGGKVQAGQGVRFVDILADAGANMGSFEDLHGHETPRAFAEAINQASSENYGHLGPAFVQAFLNRPEALEQIKSFTHHQIKNFCPEAKADGQVLRVAKRFILAAAAGEMATSWGLLPWPRNEALKSACACFKDWLSQRGGTHAHEDRAILEQVEKYFENHGSRFQDEHSTEACLNRVGFKLDGKFFVLPQSFQSEVCKGLSFSRAKKVLAENGLLLKGDGKNYASKAPRALAEFGPNQRYYVISLNRGSLSEGETSIPTIPTFPTSENQNRNKQLFENNSFSDCSDHSDQKNGVCNENYC